jgi:hypothetical protein
MTKNDELEVRKRACGVKTKDALEMSYSKEFGRYGAKVYFTKSGFESISWWSGSHNSSIAEAEEMVRNLQEAIKFAKAGKFVVPR